MDSLGHSFKWGRQCDANHAKPWRNRIPWHDLQENIAYFKPNLCVRSQWVWGQATVSKFFICHVLREKSYCQEISFRVYCRKKSGGRAWNMHVKTKILPYFDYVRAGTYRVSAKMNGTVQGLSFKDDVGKKAPPFGLDIKKRGGWLSYQTISNR